ncbi:MAG: hypothetical protein JO023_22895 [Chloroflexi bacterium]|nr:hypothetical protein [Chloroflexota bacterium]
MLSAIDVSHAWAHVVVEDQWRRVGRIRGTEVDLVLDQLTVDRTERPAAAVQVNPGQWPLPLWTP